MFEGKEVLGLLCRHYYMQLYADSDVLKQLYISYVRPHYGCTYTLYQGQEILGKGTTLCIQAGKSGH